MNKSSRRVVLTLCVALQCLYACSAMAEEKVEENFSDEVFFWGDGKITSVSKRPQSFREVSNSVYIITREDIVQSGAIKLEEVFAFIPETQLIYRSSNEPEVIVRGFPQQYSPRLLVLVDGVTVYNPVTDGVSWATLPITIDSVERIEVIRGPSSVVYGANAFSGVINIITRKPEDFEGVLGKAYAGDLGNVGAAVTLMYPVGKTGLGKKTHVRFSGEYHEDNGFGEGNGNQQYDGIHAGTIMADSFFQLSDDTDFRVGVWYRPSDVQYPVNNFVPPFSARGNNLYGMARLDTKIGKKHEFSIQSFVNRDRAEPQTQVPFSDLDMVKVDLQIEDIFHINEKNYLLFGADYRFNTVEGFIFGDPNDRQNLQMASIYVNGDMNINDHFSITAGARYEYDSFTNSNWSGRLSFIGRPTPDHILRASVARAVRTPSFIEEKTDFQIGGQGINFSGSGDPNLKAETVVAAEFEYMGYFFNNKLRADVDFFFNDLNNLILPAIGFTPPNNFAIIVGQNAGDAQLFGVEYGIRYRPWEWYELAFNHTIMRQRGIRPGEAPNNMINFVQTFRHPVGFSANLAFNWTDDFQVFDVSGVTNRPVDNLFRLDLRLAQKFLKKRLEVSFVAQGLVDYPRVEFANGLQTDRRFFGVLTYQYK